MGIPRIRSTAVLLGCLTFVACGDSSSTSDDGSRPACIGNIVDTATDVAPAHDPTIGKEGDTYYVFTTGEFARASCSGELSCASWRAWLDPTIEPTVAANGAGRIVQTRLGGILSFYSREAA